MPKPRAHAVLVPLLLLTACGTGGGAGSGAGEPDLPVAGTYWTVDAVTVDGVRSVAPDGARVDFGEKDFVGGNAGCNTFGAPVLLRGDTLTVTQAEVTGMACSGDRGRFETEFLKVFSGPLKGTMKGDGLRLASADGRNSVELTTESAVPLRGTTWKIDGLVSKDTASSLPAGSGAKARFTVGADGRVTGNLGCNNFSAHARVDEKARTLTVEGPAATTRMICTPPQMTLETRLYELLDGPLTYRLNHRTLTLTDASGEGLTATPSAR
ncbi:MULTISPECIES: META domain-containing protein [Streptomyces]|jgi:heat shock protein HslJ|uniref:Heat shock protein HslJ n=1 Tax=Streptomyces nymphaeiformis TaxID=2663842 RepID=A0A7W7U073_9ACTN|nr:META domain-containing protein [Streptomyces nymphaeiformis]MBB4982604.1 heat shock protein HslJ [Streptomyces nymphaeiformis]